jgi:uncharacterized protein DUF2630
VEDEAVLERINRLVEEEEGLYNRSREGEGLRDKEHQRLRAIEVDLDQCWDLLRQRRARRAAGENPDDAEVRDESVVERYRQ